MRNWIEYQLLKFRYHELRNKCERQRKQIAMLEQSRSDMRRNLAEIKANPVLLDYTLTADDIKRTAELFPQLRSEE